MSEAKEIELIEYPAIKIMNNNNYVIHVASIIEGKILCDWKYNKQYFN